jgi:hypothetical protein
MNITGLYFQNISGYWCQVFWMRFQIRQINYCHRKKLFNDPTILSLEYMATFWPTQGQLQANIYIKILTWRWLGLNFPSYLLDYGAKILPTFTELGTFCTHIFKNYFRTFFFMVRLIDSIEVKTVLLFIVFNFHAIIQSEIDKMFEDKKT